MKTMVKSCGIALAALLSLFLAACSQPTSNEPELPEPVSVTIAAVHGVTPPAMGEKPVTAITPADEYTGSVSWEPSIDTNFAANTKYTATITLTPKSGYTFSGVAADFFTVAGATAENDAGSGIITAVFPKTGSTPPTVVAIKNIPGVSVPETGGTPAATITETDQYTGSVSWNPPTATFAADTVYTATISLTPKSGYTFNGVTENFFTVAEATATNDADSGVIHAKFPATTPAPVTFSAITGVSVPVTGGTPVAAITPADQYTGTVNWEPSVDTTFVADTVYTATISLTPKPGYTFSGVAEDFFTVAGATATNDADSGVVTAVFPATAPAPGENPYAGEWLWGGGNFQQKPQAVKLTLLKSGEFIWRQQTIPVSAFLNSLRGTYQDTAGGVKLTITHVAKPVGSSTWSDDDADVDIVVNGALGGSRIFSGTVSGSVIGSTFTIPGPDSENIIFTKTRDETDYYDGTVYELSLGTVNGQPAWIPGPAISDIPPGTIYDKNDLSWKDEWEGDYQNHWIDVGFVNEGKVTIDLPATVPDTILRDDGFGYFGGPELDPEHSFDLMYLDGPDMGGAMFYYAENPVTDHEVDEGMFMYLNQGWNFFVYKSDTIERAESLEALYEAGYRWYLMPKVSVPALPDELPDDWETLDLAGWEEWLDEAGEPTQEQYARLVSFMRYSVNNAALSEEGRGFWNELIVYYDYSNENQTLPTPISSPVELTGPLFNDAQVYFYEMFRPREEWDGTYAPLYPNYEPDFTPITDLTNLGGVSNGILNITLPPAPATLSETVLDNLFPNGYTMSDKSAQIQFLVYLDDYAEIPEAMRIWLWDCHETIPMRSIDFVYASAATSFEGTTVEGNGSLFYNLILEPGWNTVIRYEKGNDKHYVSQPVPASAAWIYSMK